MDIATDLLEKVDDKGYLATEAVVDACSTLPDEDFVDTVAEDLRGAGWS
jgi:DNA-directed RNA polymerase specialized sigma54-like protein